MAIMLPKCNKYIIEKHCCWEAAWLSERGRTGFNVEPKNTQID